MRATYVRRIRQLGNQTRFAKRDGERRHLYSAPAVLSDFKANTGSGSEHSSDE